MAEPSDLFVLEALADAVGALATKLWYSGDNDRLAGRLGRASELLREPLLEDGDE